MKLSLSYHLFTDKSYKNLALNKGTTEECFVTEDCPTYKAKKVLIVLKGTEPYFILVIYFLLVFRMN